MRGKKNIYKQGEKIGGLIFLTPTESILNGGSKRKTGYFLCKCGVTFNARVDHVKYGITKSCGCLQIQRVKETKFIHYKLGQLINGLKYIEDVPSSRNVRLGRFVCKCGKEFVSSITSVKIGHTNSCGCYLKKRLVETHTKHRMCNSSEYLSWAHMKNRCTNINYEDFDNYGGRGISVCNRWMEFVNFIHDMGLKPTPKHTIERVDNDGNYELSNCVWATKNEQNRNKRNTVYITYKGQKTPLVTLIEKSGLNSRTVRQRVDKGWSFDKIFQGTI